ncbi:hypothetical protein LV779_15120 [Streptomyces thinghirensis]|nr:hypothetical protein [Streptomyces thinghirensis]
MTPVADHTHADRRRCGSAVLGAHPCETEPQPMRRRAERARDQGAAGDQGAGIEVGEKDPPAPARTRAPRSRRRRTCPVRRARGRGRLRPCGTCCPARRYSPCGAVVSGHTGLVPPHCSPC